MNRFMGIITEIKSSGTTMRLGVKAGANTLQTEMPHDIVEDMSLAVGKEVFLILKLRRIKAYECKCNHGKE